LFILLLSCGALGLLPVAANAQQQEAKMEERLDAEVKNFQKGKPFVDGSHDFSGSKAAGVKSANVKDFYLVRKFSLKDFVAADYHGSKSYWMGEFKYSTQAATAAAKENAEGKKQFAAKALPVKDALDSKKAFATTAQIDVDSIPKAPPQTPKVWQGTIEPMSIDDVRALLNKNK
jgi:hypothetical protein